MDARSSRSSGSAIAFCAAPVLASPPPPPAASPTKALRVCSSAISVAAASQSHTQSVPSAHAPHTWKVEAGRSAMSGGDDSRRVQW